MKISHLVTVKEERRGAMQASVIQYVRPVLQKVSQHTIRHCKNGVGSCNSLVQAIAIIHVGLHVKKKVSRLAFKW